MARKKLIVEPYSKLAAAHKLFATFMKFLIMSKIEVIDKSASTYCFTNLDFLLVCRIYFRLEALQQFPHPFLSVFYTYEALCSLHENTWSIETISCTSSSCGDSSSQFTTTMVVLNFLQNFSNQS